jgi:hypothetical protein
MYIWILEEGKKKTAHFDTRGKANRLEYAWEIL